MQETDFEKASFNYNFIEIVVNWVFFQCKRCALSYIISMGRNYSASKVPSCLQRNGLALEDLKQVILL